MLGFRVWSPIKNKFIDDGEIFMEADGRISYMIHECHFIEIGEEWPYGLGRCIAMQSTGLKDILNREIYQQDIISWPEFYIDEYRDGIYLVENIVSFIDIFARQELIMGDDHISVKVVGNAFQNPELLEKVQC